ncbi:MAG: DUF120 domain-containing protein [Thermoprotei archaeon]
MVALKKNFLGEQNERWFEFADVIVALVKMGGLNGYVRMSGSSLGSLLDASQQAASRKLSKALDAGFITRKITHGGFEYSVTPETKAVLEDFVKTVSSKPENKEISAVVVSGVGEGKLFLKLRGYAKQFEQIYGFKPFPGTLNLKSDQNVFEVFRRYPAKIVNGFRTGGRKFGLVLCYGARLRYESQKLGCVALFPEYSRYPEDLVELIAPFSIKKKLGISDGTHVRVSPAIDYA